MSARPSWMLQAWMPHRRRCWVAPLLQHQLQRDVNVATRLVRQEVQGDGRCGQQASRTVHR